MLQEDAGVSVSLSSTSQLPVLSRVCPSTRIEIVLKCCVCVSVWTDASQTRQRTSKYVPDMRTRVPCLSTKMIFDHLLKTQLKKKKKQLFSDPQFERSVDVETSELHPPSGMWTLAACLLCWWTVWMCTRCPLPARNERFPTPDIWIPGRSSEWSNVLAPGSEKQTWQLFLRNGRNEI